MFQVQFWDWVGGIVFSVEEGVSGITFRKESSESECITIMSQGKLFFRLGSVFIFDISMGGSVFISDWSRGVICVSEICEMSLGGLGGLSSLVVLFSLGSLSTVARYTKYIILCNVFDINALYLKEIKIFY